MSEMLGYHEWLMTRLSNYEEARDLFIEAMNDLEETGEVDVFGSSELSVEMELAIGMLQCLGFGSAQSCEIQRPGA